MDVEFRWNEYLKLQLRRRTHFGKLYSWGIGRCRKFRTEEKTNSKKMFFEFHRFSNMITWETPSFYSFTTASQCGKQMPQNSLWANFRNEEVAIIKIPHAWSTGEDCKLALNEAVENFWIRKSGEHFFTHAGVTNCLDRTKNAPGCQIFSNELHQISTKKMNSVVQIL